MNLNENESKVNNDSWSTNPLIVATKAVWKARSTRNASLLVVSI